MDLYLHRVGGPEEKSEASNGGEEGSGLGILVGNCSAAVEGQLVHDNQVSDAGHSIISPGGAVVLGKAGKQTGEDHENVGNNGHGDVGAAQAGEEGKVKKQEGSGNAP